MLVADVYVYDGPNAFAPRISTLHGLDLPPNQTSTGRTLYLELVADATVQV